MSERLFAIGDVHGCRVALETLLEAISPGPDDVLVALGDYVDRGPDSKGVINTLLQWGSRTRLVGLLGNHEEMMLAVLNGDYPHQEWLRHGGLATLDSYGFSGDLDFLPDDHVSFFESLGDYFTFDGFFFTHAAYDPDVPLDHQPAELLRWHSLRDGAPGPHQSGKVAVVGHTANRAGEIVDLGHLICLDTCCYGGGWLTAMELHTRRVWQASNDGTLRGSS